MKVKVDGDLQQRLGALVDSFDGAVATVVGGIVSLSAGYPWGVSLAGQGLAVPSSGPSFLSGTVTRMTLAELVMDDVSVPIRLVDRLVISDMSAPAGSLFDLLGRTSSSATGAFDEDAFEALLAGPATIEGGKGTDVIAPGSWMALDGADTIRTGAGNDRVEAGLGADRVEGGAGDDRLSGGGAADDLRGGDGRDRLAGGKGDDRLSGGGGPDVFVFAAGGGADEVRDFDPGADRIDLDPGMDVRVKDVDAGAKLVLDGATVLLPGVDAHALTEAVFT